MKAPSKLDGWLSYYLDMTNPKTFFNATQSAMAAGYNCSTYDSFRAVGAENLAKLNVQEKLIAWLDETGWSKDRIKLKLASLSEAKRIELVTYKGKITDKFEHEALNIQLQAAKYIAKLRDMEPSQKHEHSGPGGQQLEVTVKPDMTPQEASAEYFKNIRGD